MQGKRLIALGGAILAASAFGGATALASSGATASVTIRIEGRTRTLLGPRRVQVPSGGWITKARAPSGKCSASSAQGVLDVATHHRWSGKWYGSFSEYEIFTILGDKESPKHYYWEIFVDNVAASSGACAITPKAGDQLLFAVVPVKGPSVYPSALRGPAVATAGAPFTIQVVYYNAAGAVKPLAHARVTGKGVNVVTNSHGSATLDIMNPARLVLRTSPRGYVRAAPLVIQVKSFY